MKKLLLASAATALFAGSAMAEDVKIGILIGFTGPIESLTGHMANAAEAAMAEVNASGKSAYNFVSSRADSTCVDAAAAQAAAEKLVTAEGVKGLIGGDCSGVTRAVLQNVARPNGIVMVSPSATSPALTSDEDDGLFFRTAPSDAREGEVMGDILAEKASSPSRCPIRTRTTARAWPKPSLRGFTAKGGTVTINAPHDDGKADYSARSRGSGGGGWRPSGRGRLS